MWEDEGRTRVGLELYYTGHQRLEVNPYRAISRPYLIVGLLGGFTTFSSFAFETVQMLRDERWLLAGLNLAAFAAAYAAVRFKLLKQAA